ncbi:hypothetical protein HQQ94_02565 [Shewanella sp. VB17]|uniref:hypothetical protein n=1 Tax=Shewanella sp. VB17 TaxID=2739432 RepID=UPI00156673A6|nr:hypothetical protein [Shewanella sp. VB17]NRD72137.1 hypothetical protein [Shewanella sp. VB17]
MKKTPEFTLVLSLTIIPFAIMADTNVTIDDSHNTRKFTPNTENNTQYLIDLGWDSHYISEGRNNLPKGGIMWSSVAIQHNNLNVYARLGSADSLHYNEWNLGLQYTFALTENLETTLGYQRLEFYGDQRCNDNELFGLLTYSAIEWLTPSINYTYSTEASGYFVEASLHSSWELINGFTLTPYLTQAFDFQYVTEEHNGRNHFQLGIETEYLFNHNITLSGHISRTFAQQDITLEANIEKPESGLDQTFAGIHFTWIF